MSHQLHVKITKNKQSPARRARLLLWHLVDFGVKKHHSGGGWLGTAQPNVSLPYLCFGRSPKWEQDVCRGASHCLS